MKSLEHRILEAITDFPEITVAVLFGSRARGRARPDSDLDVAVLPADEGSAEPAYRLRLQLKLIQALADLAPAGRVDLVFLDEAPATLRQNIMVHGRMILCRDPAAWKRLRIATMKEYGDQEWARRRYRRALRQRLIEGRPCGRSANAHQPLERSRRLSVQAG